MNLKSTYNKIAKDWMQDHHGDTWWIDGVDTFLSFLKPNSPILDVGCGAGEKSKYLAKKGFRVTGIDFSKAMIALAKKEVPSGEFIVRDIKLPLNLGESFDGVFAQAILLHIPKKEIISVIRNTILSLKPNGYFYMAVKETKPGNPDEAVLKENNYGYEYERFFSYFTLQELKDYLRTVGMKLVYQNVISSGNTNWIQVISRKT